MRVLVVSHTYITPINRKKWQIFASLYPNIYINILFPKQWGTTLFYHKAESDFSKFDLPNCKFISMKTFKSGNEVLYWYDVKQLFSLMKELKPDIIHVEQGDNALSYAQCIVFSKLLRLKSKNVFFTWINWRQKFSLKYKIFWTWIEKINLKNSSGAFVGNVDASEILRAKGFNRKICVLPQLGVDTKIFRPAKAQNAEIPIKDVKTVAFVGRFVNEKGIFLLLDAFDAICAKYADWNLVYLGQGPYKIELEKQINVKGLQAQVIIQNIVSHDQVAKFIQSIDIMVLPSYDTDDWREQFGHVLIEAMACKVPIIGSDAGEIPNVILGVALVFKQKNTLSLQQALCLLMSDADLRVKLGAKGYDRVVEKYSHQAIAHKTYDFWIDIIKGDTCG
jgi:L-malate glycosyltransferase